MPREVIIGTSDGGTAGTDIEGDRTLPEIPSLAVVEEHMQHLRHELCGNRHAAGGYASSAAVRIAQTELARILRISDLLDQLQYWAVEESTTFRHLSSQLAETEAPEAVVACVTSGRPQLIAQALRVMAPMLSHPQTASELRRNVRPHVRHLCVETAGHEGIQRDEAEDTEEERTTAFGDPVLVLVSALMEAHRNNTAVLIESLRCATALVEVVLGCVSEEEEEEDVVVAARLVRSVVDALFTTPLVAHVESAMRRFDTQVQLQVSGAEFVAAIVKLPALTVENSDGPAEQRDAVDADCAPQQEEEDSGEVIDMSELMAHSDGIMSALCHAFHRHHTHLSLCRAVLHTWRRCAQQPQNCVSLLRHGVYGGALRQLCERGGVYRLEVLRDAAETVGYFLPLLDVLQRRSLVLELGRLVQRPQLEVVELALALLVAMLSVVRAGRCDGGASLPASSASGRGGGGAYAMYATAPQPPLRAAAAPPAAPVVSSASSSSTQKRAVRLQVSAVAWHPSSSGGAAGYDDTWSFMLRSCALPQMLSGVRQYLGNCEAVDDEDAVELQRVCALADTVLTFF